MKIVFMGSPAFAVPCLRALVEAGHEIVLVVSQPDKPAGRGAKLTAPEVKVAAEALGLGARVMQPRSARTGELASAMVASGAELAVVVAYGKILPAAVLGAVPRGCLNVHGSLLPKNRGAAPVQWAVIDGERETGVAIMQLDEGMDTGPVYAERRVAIGEDETAGELLERLAPIGAAALIDVIAGLAGGAVCAVPQDAARATHARMLAKTDGAIAFTDDAVKVASRIRGVDPWPGAYAMHRGEVLKLFRARAAVDAGAAATVVAPAGAAATTATPAAATAGMVRAPGTIVAIDKAAMHVACGDGRSVAIREVQAPGKKRLPAHVFAGGRGIAVGDLLATPADLTR